MESNKPKESKCPACKKITSFEAVHKPLLNAKYNTDVNLLLIQCADCGCVIGVINNKDCASELIIKLAKKMDINLFED